MIRYVFAIFCVILLFYSAALPARADNRVALVIGNGAYQNAPRLPNPANDAADVAASLRRAGFDTILATDLDKPAMEAAIIQFARAARTADIAMFYYSGHALQFGGINYLAPIDVKLTDEADLRRMIRVDEIVSDLQQAKNLRILVLDSCRDNPLAEELKRSIGMTRALPLQRGLAKIDSPQGMIVAYATQAGRTADDGGGRNSPYTAAFLKHIDEKEEIGSIFRRVSADVYETTKHEQLPELSLSLIGEFYLRGKVELGTSPTTSPATSSVTSDGCSTSESHWRSTEAIGTTEAYLDHLARFPTCTFAGLAKVRIEGLKNKLAAMTPPVPPTIQPRQVDEQYDPVGVTRAFYLALSAANGETAASLVVPEKRMSRAFSAPSITSFYSGLREPLRILSIVRGSTDMVDVRYRFVRANGTACSGEAHVNTIFVDGKTLIQGIAASC